MAFQLPKIDLSDAKTRVFIIVAGILGFAMVVYVGVHFFTGQKNVSGPSHVARAPSNLQSIPGGQLTPEYYRALVQANAQAAKQAQITGGSAVPTLLNEQGNQPGFQQPVAPSCTVVCPTEENVNVDNDINDLLKAGKLSAEDGKKLADLAKDKVSVSEYAANLDQLVKQGKLTPEEARKLLEDYKKQHQNSLTQESGAAMDALIKSGQLPLDAANELLELQKKGVSPTEYANKLSELVREGKISPQTAEQLLGQYTKQHAKEANAESIGQLEQMAISGQISPKVAKELEDYQKRQVPQKEYEEELQHLVKQGELTPEQAQRLLAGYRQQIQPEVAAELEGFQKRNVPIGEYQAELQKLVAAGKLSPEQAQQLLDAYQRVKNVAATGGAMSDMLKQEEKANEDAVNQLVKSGKISPETAHKLLALQQSKVPIDEYKRQLDALVRAGKLSPQDAQKLLANYQKLHGMNEEADRLKAMRASNVPLDDYAAELKQAVASGALTPDQAAALLGEYNASLRQQEAVAPAVAVPNVQGAEAYAALQKRIQTAGAAAPLKPTTGVSSEQFSAAQLRAKALAEQQEQQRLQALVGTMSQQAGQLISSWQPPVMSGQVGAAEKESPLPGAKGTEKNAAQAASASTAGGAGPIIKAGTILYAVLDTGVNSDYPDSPVLATIVQGKYKGAKLLGKLALTQGQDRVSLTFKLMNMEDWMTGKTINAYAIDPDTARSVLASNVNYHYFVRYGSLFASSFITGYANAISSSGATTSLSVTGSTTTNPVLSPSSKLLSGLGQVGKTFGTAAQAYFNTPTTVKIDPGVSLGILFMADVSG